MGRLPSRSCQDKESIHKISNGEKEAKIKNKKITRDQDTIVERQSRVVSPKWITNANQGQLSIAVEMINSVAPLTAIHISSVSDGLA